jgi:hypothetical protein
MKMMLRATIRTTAPVARSAGDRYQASSPAIGSLSCSRRLMPQTGLTSAIYNEVLQFFVIVASLVPLVIVALNSVGGSAASRTASSTQRSATRGFTRGGGLGSDTSPIRSAATGW